MAEYRYFKCRFWADSYIQSLDPTEKLLYIYLFTNEHGNQAGLYPITMRTMAFETGFSVEVVESMVSKFSQDDKIMFKNDVVWVKNFLKHQPSSGPKVLTRISRDISELNEHDLIRAYLKYNDTLSIPYQYPTDNLPIGPSEEEVEVEVEVQREEVQHAFRDESVAKQKPANLKLPAAGDATHPSKANPERPNFGKIRSWWGDMTFHEQPERGRGKPICSQLLTDEKRTALFDEIEEIATRVAPEKLIAVAEQHYTNCSRNHRPKYLSYYVPMWREQAEDPFKAGRERVDREIDEGRRKREEWKETEGDRDPEHISGLLADAKKQVDAAMEGAKNEAMEGG